MRRLAVLSTLLLGACRSEPAPPIEVAIGPGDAERERFSPRSAFAEYLELPGKKNELRITLASYEAGCDRFVAPEPGETLVTIVVVTPPGAEPRPGSHGWSGEPSGAIVAPYAAPTVRLGSKSRALPPGGSLELDRVELGLGGAVDGRAAFEFAGDAERPASVVRGAFRAKICRSNRAGQ